MNERERVHCFGLTVRWENAGFQLIAHAELQGCFIADPGLEPDFRICSELYDRNIDLATNNCITGEIKNLQFCCSSYFLSFPESDFFLRHVLSQVRTDPCTDYHSFSSLLLAAEVSSCDSFNVSAVGTCSSQTPHAASPSYH